MKFSFYKIAFSHLNKLMHMFTKLADCFYMLAKILKAHLKELKHLITFSKCHLMLFNREFALNLKFS